jgi:hypothetical protein
MAKFGSSSANFGGSLKKKIMTPRNPLSVSVSDRLRCKPVARRDVERWGCRLIERGVVFLHGAQRFSELPVHLRSHLAKRIKHRALIVCLSFSTCQQVSTGAIDGAEDQIISSADQRNRTIQYRCTVGSLTNLPSDFRRELSTTTLQLIS